MAEDYGRRLLPSILHKVAKNHPQQTFALIARSDSIEDGYEKVTYRQVADAVNYVAQWLLDRFEHGKKTSQHSTLAYVGPNDLRYNILFYGAVQCRYKVFLPSPRNPVGINISLLEQTECTRMVFATELTTLVKSLQQADSTIELQYEQIPSLRELLTAPKIDFRYELEFADVYKEPILVLHSSGSTGRPKPVVLTHGSLATIDVRDFPTVPDRRNQDFVSTFQFEEPESYMYDVFPLFHLAGFNAKVIVPLIIGSIPIFDSPSRPPSGALVAQTIRLCNPRGLYLPPVIIEQVFQEPDAEDLFSKRDMVFYAGGPLSQTTGSQIANWTQLCQFYGSTEVGQVRQLQPLRTGDDWAYLEFHPNEVFELQPIEEGASLHELVLFTGKHLEKTSQLHHNYPDLTEWRTKDLFEQHPTKPSLWKFHARVDDILVLSSGEKLNPIPLESYMSTIPGVRGALVVGTRYPRPALLLELSDNHTFSDPVPDLWPSIDKGNSLLSGHGRITRQMVIIARADKPFKRAPKGSIVRRQTEDLYEDEIASLYHSASSKTTEAKLVSFRPSAFRQEDVDQLLRSILGHVSIDGALDSNASLYENGLDSVKTAEVVGLLKANLLPYKPEEKLRWLTLETIYLNPTVGQLGNILLAFLNDNKTPVKLGTAEEIRAKIDEYTLNLPAQKSGDRMSNGHTSGGAAIAITGTTGFFGQYLLSKLVTYPEISRIYCLNRSPLAQEKFQKLGLKHEKELVFLRIDISAPQLGLSHDDYTLLLRDCSLILHNAWQVDFNLPLEAFDVHLKGIQRIATLCAESTLRPRLMFISSIASTGVWSPPDHPKRTIPENMIGTDSVSGGMDIGYAKAKCVAEHVIDKAATAYDFPATILRLGHVMPAASHGRSWPSNDSFALFLRTSKEIGKLASDYLDTVNWMPADAGADIVCDLVQNALLDTRKESTETQVFNIVNPDERPWSSIMDPLTKWCGAQTTQISLKEWTKELHETKGHDTKALDRLPALRIFQFFDLLSRRGPVHQYETEKARGLSKAMRALKAPDDGLVDEWLSLL